MDEFAIIRRFFAPLTKGLAGALNLSDDAALIDVPAGMQLVATKDAICEKVHFLGGEDPALIAQKLLRTNLSDLAAKGATPLTYLLAIALPKDTPENFIARFAEGLEHDQTEFGIDLAGGDTTATHGSMVLSLTALGLVPTGTMLKRSDARAGNLLCVSGTLGDSALGLKRLQNTLGCTLTAAEQEYLEGRYFLPQPRLTLGQALRGLATACMDISDGLVQDTAHLCTASSCGAIIEARKIPLSPAARTALDQNPTLREAILTGGDDYELLFTLPENKLADAQALGTPIAVIGRIHEGSGVKVVDESGHEMILEQQGYRHF